MKSINVLFFCFLFFCLEAQHPKSAVIKPYNGRPTIFINNTPQTPAFYALTHAYGGRWSWEEVAGRNINNFCQIGFKLFQVDLYFEDIWFKNKSGLDIQKAQKQVKGVLDQCPDANVIVRIHVNAPFWWNEAHPEECTAFADGPVDTTLKAGAPYHNEEHDIRRALRTSLASTRWKKESGDKLIEFCHKLSKTPEGNSVIGMHVAGGIYGEWHYWGFIDHDPDTGPAMISYFRNWLKSKYQNTQNLQKAWQNSNFTLENASVPNSDERLKTQDGFSKDPSVEQRVIDYFTAQQQAVADDAEYFCRIVKMNWPRPIITGIFYGYLHMTFNRQTVGGHLCIKQILESKFIDYLSAPQTYWGESRNAGGSGNSRGIIESTLLHGKLWLDEIDNGYLHPKTDYDNIRYKERYDSSYATIIRRSAVLPLMRGIGFWFYDFGIQKGFGWWDNPKYLKSMKAEKELFDRRQTIPYHSDADVLYVWSQDVFYYLKSATLPITVNVLDHSIEQALRSGTVGDHIYDFDLKLVNLDQYKAVVFMNVYKLSDEQRMYIKEKVCQHHRTIIWNYLTGFTNGERLDIAFVQSLASMNLGRLELSTAPEVNFIIPSYKYKFNGIISPFYVVEDKKTETLARLNNTSISLIARKKMMDYTSVYCSTPLNGTNGFREIFREAGCHIYNEQNDFTYSNSGLLMLHTKDGGKRKIRLKNNKVIEIDLIKGSTLVMDNTSGEIIL
ncbi:MAG: hypothetical protein ABIR66_10325 [Saprospiraceae bacterium]